MVVDVIVMGVEVLIDFTKDIRGQIKKINDGMLSADAYPISAIEPNEVAQDRYAMTISLPCSGTMMLSSRSWDQVPLNPSAAIYLKFWVSWAGMIPSICLESRARRLEINVFIQTTLSHPQPFFHCYAYLRGSRLLFSFLLSLVVNSASQETS